MKRLQLVRKKLLPLLLCVAVAGSQVPVMAADVEGFSDSAEGFNEEWSEDTQTQPAEAEDTAPAAGSRPVSRVSTRTAEHKRFIAGSFQTDGRMGDRARDPGGPGHG